MPPTVSIVIEADDGAASAALDQLNQRAAALPPVFDNLSKTSDSVFSQMQENIHSTRMTTDLLTGNVQRAEQSLVRMAAATSALGPLISAAFVPFAVITFGELIVHTTEEIAKLVTGEKEAADAAKALQAAHEEAFKADERYAAEEDKFQRELAAVGLKGADALRQEAEASALTAAVQQNKLAGLQAIAAVQKKIIDDDQQQWNATKARNPLASAGMPDQSPQIKTETAALAQFNAEVAKQAVVTKTATDEATLYAEKMKAAYGEEQVQSVQKLTEAEDKLMNDSIQASDEYYKQLGEQDKKNNELKRKGMQDLDMQMVDNMVADQKVAANAQEQAKKYAEAWTRARDTMANQLDSFFNELTSGNIGQAFLKQFEKLVSQMVATWLMGVQGIQQSVTRSGGLFGTLLGYGEGSGRPAGGALSGLPGIDASFMNGSDMGGILTGVPLSGGGGAGSVGLGALPAGASNVGALGAVGGSGGGFLSMLSGLLPIGALAGGSALLGKGGILGLLGSGALGFGAGAVAGPLLASIATPLMESGVISGALAGTLESIAPFLGPIGAGIGLITGLIGLFSGNGKLKTQQANLQNQEQNDLLRLQEAFNLHQIDYNSAISQAEQIRQSYTSQQESLQKGGSVGRVDAVVDDIEQQINNIEQQRQNVLGAAGNYGPAQFSAGGFVHPSMARMVPPGFAPAMHFAMGGAVPAIVHVGEYVLNAGAVSQIGVRKLDSMNGGAGVGDVHLHFPSVYDANGFEETLKNNVPALTRTIRRAVAEGGM